MRRQLLITAIIFWTFVLMINLLRPQITSDNTLRSKNSSDKIHWKNRFDIAVAGDSRVLIGISPRSMQKILPGYEIGNLGFIALIYSQDYLNYIKNTLHSPVKNRVIVINFSPRSFLSQESHNCYFRKLNEDAKIPFRTKLDRCSRWFQLLFQELSDEDLNHRFRKDKSRYLMVSFESGWMASRLFPESQGASKGQYKSLFMKNKIDEELLDIIYHNTKTWTAEGIKVFGIRMPVSPSIFVIEKEKSGFQIENIRQRFEKCGGIWLDPPINNLVVYDGAHLRYDSAATYSRRLAEELKKYLDEKQ
jgi:hypothetical protein